MIQNLTQTFGSYAPSWSITNEVFYYVFFGLLTFAVARRSRWPATIGMGDFLVDRRDDAGLVPAGLQGDADTGDGFTVRAWGSTGSSGPWSPSIVAGWHEAVRFQHLGRCWVPVLVGVDRHVVQPEGQARVRLYHVRAWHSP